MKFDSIIKAALCPFVLLLSSCDKTTTTPSGHEYNLEIETDKVEIPGNGGTVSLKVTTNYTVVTAAGNEKWCKCSLSEGLDVLTVSADANIDEPRTAVVTVAALENGNRDSKVVVVSQGKAKTSPYIAVSKIDFDDSRAVDIILGSSTLARAYREYVYTSDSSVDKVMDVIYPIGSDGKLNLAAGIDLRTGGKLSWDISAADNDVCTFTPMAGPAPETLYFTEAGISFTKPSDGVFAEAEAKPVMITDIRKGQAVVYPLVKIGSQLWMAANLRAESYANGKALSELWDANGSFATYLYDSEFTEFFGHVYNGYAVLSGEGLAPKGWEIPSLDQWNILYNYLRNKRGTKLKNETWISSSESAEYANITGMDIDLAYAYLPDGSGTGWNDEMEKTYFWTTTEDASASEKSLRYVYFAKSSNSMNRSLSSTLDLSHGMDYGNYVRCVKSLR